MSTKLLNQGRGVTWAIFMDGEIVAGKKVTSYLYMFLPGTGTEIYYLK